MTPATVASARAIGKIENRALQAMTIAWLGPSSARNLSSTRATNVRDAWTANPFSRTTVRRLRYGLRYGYGGVRLQPTRAGRGARRGRGGRVAGQRRRKGRARPAGRGGGDQQGDRRGALAGGRHRAEAARGAGRPGAGGRAPRDLRGGGPAGPRRDRHRLN